jgi:hypothetical protein
MGRTCDRHEVGRKNILVGTSKVMRPRRIIGVIRKWGVRIWIVFNWLTIESSGRFL